MTSLDSQPLALRISDLYKSFGPTPVLRGISLDVMRGEAVAIIGPSGAGKSTLLKCINLLLPFEDGSIEISEDLVILATRGHVDLPLSLPNLRRRVGLVFQEWNLWPNKTVRENIAEGPRIVRKMSRREAYILAEQLCARVGLSDKLSAYPAELSGGQKQRAAIARALAMEPTLLLLDEITSALDPPLVTEVLDVISSLKTSDRALVIVTHHIDFAKRVASRVAFLWKGKIVEFGPARQILEDPRTPELQDFLCSLRRTW